jgi:DNA (cytosine-5)-methyltransferase 1
VFIKKASNRIHRTFGRFCNIDICKLTEPHLHSCRTRGTEAQSGRQPSGQSCRDQECGTILDPVLGHPGRQRLDAGAVPLFAPGPGEFGKWGEILKGWPQLKPCLYRPDDGLAHGLDRSAAAGNGVVPMAAARAFEELLKEVSKTV